MNKKRVAIIGTGGISQAHIRGYELAKDLAEVVACCDLDGDKAREYARAHNIPRVYTDCEQMLRAETPDCVSVCTWNSSHAPVSIAAMRAGAHVLCEKPMSLTVEEALEMEKTAEETGRLLQIGFVRRFGRDAEAIRRLIQAGVMGDIYYARTHFLRRSGGPGGWYCDKAYSGGGPLIDLGVHMIDLVWYLAGKPRPVSALAVWHSGLDGARALDGKRDWESTTAPSRFQMDTEDMVSALILFENGFSVHVEVSSALNIGETGKNVELFGEKAGAKIGADGKLEYTTTQAGMFVNCRPTANAVFAFEDAFPAQIRGFLRATDGGECRAPARDAVAIMKILSAIYQSARTGRQVWIEA